MKNSNLNRRYFLTLFISALSFGTSAIAKTSIKYINDIQSSKNKSTKYSHYDNIKTFKIAFGSCLDQNLSQPIWSAIIEDNPDAFIFLGDNVYGDSNEKNLSKLKEAYSKQKQNLPVFLKNGDKKIYSIWDDHDYGENDGSSSFEHKKKSQKLFLEFWEIPKNDHRHHQQGIYFDSEFNVGKLRVHLIGLDTRYFRSDIKKYYDYPYTIRKFLLSPLLRNKYFSNLFPNKTILGDTQWNWFRKIFKKEADLKIILSSIQVLASNHRYEKWMLFPKERKKMLDLICKSNVKTIVLSGDRHKGCIYKYKDIYEITSSSLNKPSIKDDVEETDDLKVSQVYEKENYGMICITNKIQQKNSKYEINFGIKDIKGKYVNKYKL